MTARRIVRQVRAVRVRRMALVGKRMITRHNTTFNRPSTRSSTINHRRKFIKPSPRNGASHAKCRKRVAVWTVRVNISIVNTMRFVHVKSFILAGQKWFTVHFPFHRTSKTRPMVVWVRALQCSSMKWCTDRPVQSFKTRMRQQNYLFCRLHIRGDLHYDIDSHSTRRKWNWCAVNWLSDLQMEFETNNEHFFLLETEIFLKNTQRIKYTNDRKGSNNWWWLMIDHAWRVQHEHPV